MWTLYKRGSVWWAVQTTDGVRERRSTKCSDRKAAELTVREWERTAADPRHRAANTTTLEDALGRLILDRRARGKAAGTIKMYQQKCAQLVRVLGRGLLLSELGATHVDHFVDVRLADEAARNTIGKELGALRAALRLARRRGEFDKDVAEVMPIGWSNEYTPKRTFLTPDQLRALLEALPGERARHVAFIVATGVRWSESLRAEAVDVDVETWTFRARGTKTKASDARVAVSPLSRRLVEFAIAGAPADGPMFGSWGNVRRDLHAACKRATKARIAAAEDALRGAELGEDARKLLEVPVVTPNDLRRTAASWLVQHGASLFAVSKVLRHTDTRMVERVYGQVSGGDLVRLLERETAGASPVSIVCPTETNPGDQRDAEDDPIEEKSSDPSCPGAESNRRHADFQSKGETANGSRNYERSSTASVADVSIMCPGEDAEDPPSGGLPDSAVAPAAWGAYLALRATADFRARSFAFLTDRLDRWSLLEVSP